MAADVTKREREAINSENNELFFGCVKAFEYLTGCPKRERPEVVQYLERILVAYGVRNGTEEIIGYRGVDMRQVAIAQERAGVVVPDHKTVKLMVHILEEASEPLTTNSLRMAMTLKFKYVWKRDAPLQELLYYLGKHRDIFRVAHFKARSVTGGKVNYWSLMWK